ncbi:double-stranded RNA-specific editase Adar-like isoform X2 [Cylas formicarius]|uniref:double-stranded RNA-specific editase Adar-like isoform X2 n=1 Tax=Cylas formicarius TaxID=197179 RepID=UPI00295867D6|nr:double-stranded RNA-specific editase Adar-like isoform X2 [Cylas formicarius]
MSYNTRRSSGFNPNQQNVGNIGQRRPVVTNNFVPGGQLQPQPQQKSQPGYNQPPQRSQQQGQQQAQINFRNQQQRPQPQQQTVPPQAYGNQQPPQQPNFQQIKVEPTTPVKPPTPVVPAPNPPAPENKDVDAMDTSGEGEDGKVKRRPIWARGIKISRKEKLRRRNLRLSKMLQPKNAVMILHELVKNTAYEVEELSCKIDNNQYKATVMFEGETHVGLGRSKIQAKNAAAENALKYLVKNKQLKLTKSEEGTEGGGGGGGRQDDTTEEGEKMDIQTDEGSTVMPWQHVASFALFKLFSSWGEDPVLTSRVSQAQELLGGPKVAVTPGERVDTITKPAKKLPNKPEEINPLMLLNQMCPQAQFEELGKAGTPPNVTFTFQVTIDGQTFNGSGPNKKTAKRLAAYAACHSVLKISYPPEIWVPGF